MLCIKGLKHFLIFLRNSTRAHSCRSVYAPPGGGITDDYKEEEDAAEDEDFLTVPTFKD